MKGARLYTLPIGLAPVLMAMATVFRVLSPNDTACGYGCTMYLVFFERSLLAIIVAVGLQIAANYANDYSDGLRGLDDARNKRLPQSSTGSGTAFCDVSWRMRDAGIAPRAVLWAAVISASVSLGAGLLLTITTQCWWYIPLGVICVLAAWFYAGGRHPYGSYALGELSAFCFFGPVAFLGSLHAMLYGLGVGFTVHPGLIINVLFAVLVSCIPGGFSACLMMINNLRDIDVDQAHGKQTLMALLGRTRGSRCCAVVATCATLICVATMWMRILLPNLVPSYMYVHVGDDLMEFGFSYWTQFYALRVALYTLLTAVLFAALWRFVKTITSFDMLHAFRLCVLCAMFNTLSILILVA